MSNRFEPTQIEPRLKPNQKTDSNRTVIRFTDNAASKTECEPSLVAEWMVKAVEIL
jgi:hypothetical protein